eukprot:42695-Pelagomonas_calceolata.AAC.7
MHLNDHANPRQNALQVDRVADKNSYLEVCISLRKEQDEEVALSNQMQASNCRSREQASLWVARSASAD